jgi:hypothetical protein
MRLAALVFISIAMLAQTAPEEKPVPAERSLTGSVDLGYRWISGVGGSFDTYRSIVDLGEGPKLFGVDLTLAQPGNKFFDRAEIHGNNWGDPYNTARARIVKTGIYDFSADYRNIAYFNFLPSFANPLIDRGVILNERSFDIHRRMANFNLELRPGARIVPYVSYTRDSGHGRGITSFVSDANEYPVATHPRDKNDDFRGGVRLMLKRLHVTLEEGGTRFKDDQNVFTSDHNSGNRGTPVLGQQLFLDTLVQAYGIRTSGSYTRALLTANPFEWLELSGQFRYSQLQSDVSYNQDNSGQFVQLQPFLFFTREVTLLSGQASQPHTAGSFGAALRPFRRLRILENWTTDRLHTASSALLDSQLFTTPADTVTLSTLSGDRLVWNYSTQQIDVLFDVTSHLMIRAGHRYVWGNASNRAPQLGDPSGIENGEMRRQAGLAGIAFRTGQKLRLNADFEGSPGDRTWFRTSLNEYKKFRARASYQLFNSLLLAADFSLLNNDNPAPDIQYSLRNRNTSLALEWSPAGAKRFSLSGEYTRSTLSSDALFRIPQTLEQDRSIYRDRAHIASGFLDLHLPASGRVAPRLSFGGSFFKASGTRPTSYYQPAINLFIPIGPHVEWTTQWRWYGFAEPLYGYEDFRSNQLMVGLRLTR